MFPITGPEEPLLLEETQAANAASRFDNYVSPITPIAPVWPTEGDVLFMPKTHGTIAAITSLYPYFCPIKHR